MTEETGQEVDERFYSSKMVRCISKRVKNMLVKKEVFLPKEAREELVLEMRCRVLGEVAKYDALRSSPFTYAISIVNKQMVNWLRYNARCYRADEIAKRSIILLTNYAYNEKRRATVHRVLRRLSFESQRLCELVMIYATLEEVREFLGTSKRRFYEKMWNPCRSEFKRIYAEEWV